MAQRIALSCQSESDCRPSVNRRFDSNLSTDLQFCQECGAARFFHDKIERVVNDSGEWESQAGLKMPSSFMIVQSKAIDIFEDLFAFGFGLNPLIKLCAKQFGEFRRHLRLHLVQFFVCLLSDNLSRLQLTNNRPDRGLCRIFTRGES